MADWKFGDIVKIDPKYLPGTAYHEHRAMFVATGAQTEVIVLRRDPRDARQGSGEFSAINPNVWITEEPR